jgi:hypothetical protein
LSSKVKLGADASAAADTDIVMRAEVLSYFSLAWLIRRHFAGGFDPPV